MHDHAAFWYSPGLIPVQRLKARPKLLWSAKPSMYEMHFQVPVAFGCSDSSIELRAADLALPIEDASVQLRDLAEDYLELHHDIPGTPLSARVRMVIQRSLGTGSTSCTDVAAAFALHPRTLQRLLRDEGTTFERIKDDVRAELARSYLANEDLP